MGALLAPLNRGYSSPHSSYLVSGQSRGLVMSGMSGVSVIGSKGPYGARLAP